jgi:GNAT superfamily N-acetyltransferase
MIEYRQLNAKKLKEYVTSAEYLSMPERPISVQRAISQINNPRCHDDDILLILAYDSEQMVGYLGALPDEIYGGNDQVIHGAWLTCLWVNPNYRGQKIAQHLFAAAFKAYDDNVLLTDFASDTEMMYTRLGTFDTFAAIVGRRYYIRSNVANILAPKKPIFKKLSPLLRVMDFCINTTLDILTRIKGSSHKSDDLPIFDLKNITTDHINFINQQAQNQYFRRDIQDMKWMLAWPWVLEKPTPEAGDHKYYFSSSDKIFTQNTFEVRSKDSQLLAFLLVTNRNGHLKIPYCYLSPDTHTNEVQHLLQRIVYTQQIHTVTIFNEELNKYLLRFPLSSLYTKNIDRKYIMSKILNQRLVKSNNYMIHDGDGDCGFV